MITMKEWQDKIKDDETWEQYRELVNDEEELAIDILNAKGDCK